jgi:16S rRNA (adenine1518-N6/adenine1519-N6)-dimethyltransferase
MFKLQELKTKLLELGIVPRKSKGQNFLINSDAIGNIIKAVMSYKNHSIIEVGPGLGALKE